MRNGSNAARLRIMNTPPANDSADRRRRALFERLERLNIDEMSDREAKKVLNISRETWAKLRTGQYVYPSSLTKAEEGLAAYVEEHDLQEVEAAEQERAPEVFELTVSVGALDLQVSAKGRPEDADVVREQVARIVADMMRESRNPDTQ